MTRQIFYKADQEPTPADPDAPTESISVMVTPQMASVWRKKWHYSGQRTFRQGHCDNLVRMMKEGIFRPKTQVAFVLAGGKFHMTNGQHTLAAVELSRMTQELCVVVSNGATMEDVADDFSRQDTHMTRRFGDSLIAHGVHEELGVSISVLHHITAAVAYYASLRGEINVRLSAMTHDQKLQLVRKHGHLATKAYSYLAGATNREFLTRRTTLACVMLCAEAHDGAEAFWTGVARDDGLRQGDPRKTLLEWLRLRGTTSARVVGGERKFAADHELVKGIATAWSAWVQNRELKVIKGNFDGAVANFERIGSFVVRRQAAKSGRKTQSDDVLA